MVKMKDAHAEMPQNVEERFCMAASAGQLQAVVIRMCSLWNVFSMECVHYRMCSL
jgi:hypothetical protein